MHFFYQVVFYDTAVTCQNIQFSVYILSYLYLQIFIETYHRGSIFFVVNHYKFVERKERLRASIFESADTSHLIASAK